MKKILVLYAVMLCTLGAFPAFAAMDAVNFQENLNTLNRIKPLQSPQFKKSAQILSSKIIDQQNKNVGKVEDVLVKANSGAVTSLQVDFDRLRLGQPVFLNYQEMKIGSVSNGYQLGLKGDELAEIYPELLANIETAAGTNNEILSVKSLIGQSVIGEDSRKIGEIQDVLFSKEGAKAEAVYVNVNSGIIRNVGVAIPIAALNISEFHGRVSATLPQDQADLLVEFAKKRK